MRRVIDLSTGCRIRNEGYKEDGSLTAVVELKSAVAGVADPSEFLVPEDYQQIES